MASVVEIVIDPVPDGAVKEYGVFSAVIVGVGDPVDESAKEPDWPNCIAPDPDSVGVGGPA